jgi:hypothetical protein
LARWGWEGENRGLFEHPEAVFDIGAIWKIANGI